MRHGSGGPGHCLRSARPVLRQAKGLQTQSGIKQADLLGAAGLKRSQVSDILNGKIERPPDWGVTIAIVGACLEHAKAASRLVPPDLSDEADWQRRYFDLEQDLDTGARAKPRREEPAGCLLAERPTRSPWKSIIPCSPMALSTGCRRCSRTWPGTTTRS